MGSHYKSLYCMSQKVYHQVGEAKSYLEWQQLYVYWCSQSDETTKSIPGSENNSRVCLRLPIFPDACSEIYSPACSALWMFVGSRHEEHEEASEEGDRGSEADLEELVNHGCVPDRTLVVSQIEACLNSRLLVPLASDDEDLAVLTP